MQDDVVSVSNFPPIFVVSFLVFIVDFYIESIASVKLDTHVSTGMGAITSFIAALAIALYWEHVPFTALKPYEMQKHGIAAGAVFAAVCFITGEFSDWFRIRLLLLKLFLTKTVVIVLAETITTQKQLQLYSLTSQCFQKISWFTKIYLVMPYLR